jgi:L-fuculose-phosphate aldolase
VADEADPTGLETVSKHLVAYSKRLLDDGLAAGSAGNLSARIVAGARAGEVVAITPSGVGYRELGPADICTVTLDGAEISAPETPSTETPMHLAIYAATAARAIVHTHSPEVIALSAARTELPAIHYAITGLGGPVRVAPYTRFGSAGLAEAAVAALDGRQAAILQNHGAICYGSSIAEAYDRALLLEWLARVYRLACCYGEPQVLSLNDLAQVSAETQRIGYGQRRRRD